MVFSSLHPQLCASVSASGSIIPVQSYSLQAATGFFFCEKGSHRPFFLKQAATGFEQTCGTRSVSMESDTEERRPGRAIIIQRVLLFELPLCCHFVRVRHAFRPSFYHVPVKCKWRRRSLRSKLAALVINRVLPH
jgi:hypothetical protein